MGTGIFMNFIRITDPNYVQLIPRRLFEQIKELDSETIDRIYYYASSILTQVVPNELGQLVRQPNPLVWLAAITDDNRKQVGFLWLDFDLIEESIYVQYLSVDKKFQGNGLLEEVKKYIYEPINSSAEY